jgi:hypothetical protein
LPSSVACSCPRRTNAATSASSSSAGASSGHCHYLLAPVRGHGRSMGTRRL